MDEILLSRCSPVFKSSLKFGAMVIVLQFHLLFFNCNWHSAFVISIASDIYFITEGVLLQI